MAATQTRIGLLLLCCLHVTLPMRVLDMDRLSSCASGANNEPIIVYDDPVVLNAHSRSPPPNPPTTCTVMFKSGFTEADGYQLLEVVIEKVDIRDSQVFVAIFNGLGAYGSYLRNLGKNSQSTDVLYTTGSEATVRLTRPATLYQTAYDVTLQFVAYNPARGFGGGAPGSSCLNLYPKHGALPQATPSPFSISVTPANFTPSQQLTVVVNASDGRQFAGLAMVVQRPTGAFDDEEALGSFNVSAILGKLKTIDCLGGTRNFLTHRVSTPYTSLQFTWTAPATNTGPVVFRATVVETKEVFWTGIEQPVYPEDSSTVVSPSYENPPVSGTISSVDLTTCGTAKSCVLYPSNCSANTATCTRALTFVKNGADITFEMFAPAEAYVSLGLSNDTRMSDDQTVTCVADSSGRTSVQHGYNPEHYNFQQYRRGLRDLATKNEDGTVYCRFAMPPDMRVFTFTGNKTFPFSQPHYLMLAWGGVYQGTVVIKHHSAMPLVTSTTVLLEGQARLYQWGDGHGHSHDDVNDGSRNGHDVTRPAYGVTLSALLLVFYARA